MMPYWSCPVTNIICTFAYPLYLVIVSLLTQFSSYSVFYLVLHLTWLVLHTCIVVLFFVSSRVFILDSSNLYLKLLDVLSNLLSTSFFTIYQRLQIGKESEDKSVGMHVCSTPVRCLLSELFLYWALFIYHQNVPAQAQCYVPLGCFSSSSASSSDSASWVDRNNDTGACITWKHAE